MYAFGKQIMNSLFRNFKIYLQGTTKVYFSHFPFSKWTKKASVAKRDQKCFCTSLSHIGLKRYYLQVKLHPIAANNHMYALSNLTESGL